MAKNKSYAAKDYFMMLVKLTGYLLIYSVVSLFIIFIIYITMLSVKHLDVEKVLILKVLNNNYTNKLKILIATAASASILKTSTDAFKSIKSIRPIKNIELIERLIILTILTTISIKYFKK